MNARTLAFAVLCTVASGGCGHFPTLDEHPCPPGGTTLTYDNFGLGFFSRHCSGCHGGVDGHSARSFTSVDLIRAQKERVFANATGPNPPMPPGPDDPSDLERKQLAEWLSCDAP